MNPLLNKLYRQKKTRVRDPNAPPPPTLLGQVKELKDTKQSVESVSAEMAVMRQRLEYLEMKNRRLENNIETIRAWILRNQRR
ncbi:hypothetical protein UFOVP1636_104 [uncultured Caudovirales phage]|uniref:Uncharacterized protein n=1 Tax=uncultured Caudovirales phage TaxID=2100421 RepID=A0A6J5SZG0_9CAUD|nr:hypothetical protein UFOVP1636_104 [uncultured Caudovirales phage]